MPNLVSKCESLNGTLYKVAIENANWSEYHTGYSPMALSPELFVINDNGESKNMWNRIITKSCTLSVYMDSLAIRSTYEEIINSPDGYYTLRITTGPLDEMLYIGIILCDLDEIDDSARPFFTLTAICGLSSLKYVNYDEITVIPFLGNAKAQLPINYVKAINFCLMKSPVFSRYQALMGVSKRETFISSTKISEPFIGGDDPMQVMGVENIWVNKDQRTGFVKYATCLEVIQALMTSLNMRMTVAFGRFICISIDIMNEQDRVLYVHYDDNTNAVLTGVDELYKKQLEIGWEDNDFYLLEGGKFGYLPGLKEVNFNLISENINVNYNHINREIFNSKDPYDYRKLSFVSQSNNFLFFALNFIVTTDALDAQFVRFEIQIRVGENNWVDGGLNIIHQRPGIFGNAFAIGAEYAGSEKSVIFETTMRDTDPVFNNILYGHKKGVLIKVPNNEDGFIYLRWRAVGVYNANRQLISGAVIQWSSLDDSRILISENVILPINENLSFDFFKNKVDKSYVIKAVNNTQYVTSYKEDFFLADANADLKNISLFRSNIYNLLTAGPGDYKLTERTWTYKGSGSWNIEELIMYLILSMQSKPVKYYSGSVYGKFFMMPLWMQPHNTFLIRGDIMMILDGEMVAGTDTYTGTFVKIGKVSVTPTFERPQAPNEIEIFEDDIATSGFSGLVPASTNRQRLYKRFNPAGDEVRVKYYLVHALADYTFDSIDASVQVYMTGVKARRRTEMAQDADYLLTYDTALSEFTIKMRRAQTGKLVEVVIDNFFELKPDEIII